MKLSNSQDAPYFSTTDVYGAAIDLKKLRGNKVYLSFERNAGCPVCNLRMHKLLKEAEFFKTNNITVLMVYESPLKKMKEYLGENKYPFHFLSDPHAKLYNLYGVEKSMAKVLKGLAHGLMSKVIAGYKLFKKPMMQDGALNRIPAEFLIDEKGKLIAAHYGKFIGDHIPIETLKKMLN